MIKTNVHNWLKEKPGSTKMNEFSVGTPFQSKHFLGDSNHLRPLYHAAGLQAHVHLNPILLPGNSLPLWSGNEACEKELARNNMCLDHLRIDVLSVDHLKSGVNREEESVLSGDFKHPL